MNKHTVWYQPTFWWLPGLLSLLVLAAVVVMPFVTLLREFAFQDGLTVLTSSYTWRVVKFSLWQASLSTALSLALAIPMAIALSRIPAFPGRSLLLRFFSIPLVLPTLVAITGIIVVYGRSGWLMDLWSFSGSDYQYRFYGLGGILTAHIFFNFPLATRVLLQTLDSVPAENWRLAGQFGLRGLEQFRWIELPVLLRVMPSIALLIFSLCFTSFAVVLTLGGGPSATTIEVAIYQALKQDFDIPVAVVLALLQISVCGLILLLGSLLGKPVIPGGFHLGNKSRFLPGKQWPLKFVLAAGSLFVFTPLLAVLVHGVNSNTLTVISDFTVLKSLSITLVLGASAGLLAVFLASGLLLTSRHLRKRMNQEMSGRLLSSTGLMILIMPSVVLGAGLFLWLHRYIDVFSQAAWLVLLINALASLPFAIATLEDSFNTVAKNNDRLCAALNLYGFNRFRFVEWPLLRRPLGLATGLCSAMAAGDLTAIALFGSDTFQTLPLLLYQRLGAYRMDEASVIAMLLMLTGLALYFFFDRIFQSGHHA